MIVPSCGESVARWNENMSQAERVAVLIVDRHPILRDALRAAVQSLLIVDSVADVQSLAEARLCVEPDTKHLLLVDHLPVGKRENLYLEGIRRACPELLMVHFAADESLSNIEESLQAGFDGFVPKSVSITSLLTAIETVLTGAKYFPVLAAADSEDRQHPMANAPILLSRRRRQVLHCVLKGQSNAEISQALDIAEGTVKNHVSHIMRAFDVSNRARLILRARGSGMG